MKKLVALLSLIFVLASASPTFAQLNNTFKQVFDYFLRTKIRLSGTTGESHGTHYLPAAIEADSLLRPALNRLITTNVSSFPLSSTTAGVTFDFSSGRPVSLLESLGPVFAENAATLGKGKLNVAFNYTYLNLIRFRGIPTNDIRFTFAHLNVNPANFGNPQFENDFIDMFLNLDVNASISVLFATYGVTNKLDVNVAVPFVHLSLNGRAKASITSLTFGRIRSNNPTAEGAAHRFGGSLLNPILDADTLYSASASGLGDIALRVKYSFLRGAGVNMAALLDVRFPTGEENDFLGTGETNARVSGIVSKKMGNFTPHLNLTYEKRPIDFDSDQLEIVAGFDQKIASGVTFAGEFFGAFALNNAETIKFFREDTVEISDSFRGTTGATGSLTRKVDLTNIPHRKNDQMFDVSLGFRIAPSERLLILGNVIVPLNDGGLRSSVAPTLGVNVNF